MRKMNQRETEKYTAQIIPESVLMEMCREMTPNQLTKMAEEGKIIPDQALEMGLITYNQYLQMRLTVEQMEKMALRMSQRSRKEPWKIMEQLVKQEQEKRKMTPLEKKAAKAIVKSLQQERPLNRQERRAREKKLRRRKNQQKS